MTRVRTNSCVRSALVSPHLGCPHDSARSRVFLCVPAVGRAPTRRPSPSRWTPASCRASSSAPPSTSRASPGRSSSGTRSGSPGRTAARPRRGHRRAPHRTTDGTALPWTRDEVELHCFAVIVPDGATAVRVKLDTICEGSGRRAPGHIPSAPRTSASSTGTPFSFTPGGPAADAQPVTVRLRLPDGWKHATALKSEKEKGKDGATSFQTFRSPHSWTARSSPAGT
jgi:hypothetical protein